MVDLVPEAHSVYHSQLEVDVALLQIICSWEHLYLLVIMARFLIFKDCSEKSVDKGGLSYTGLPWRNSKWKKR